MAEDRIELLAPSPSQPLSPVARLPREVLSVILCNLLVPERLRTASRVCKHWRRIVLASFTSIRLHTEAATGPHLNAALALLPSLRHLKLRNSDTGRVVLRLPASLSALSLCASSPLSLDRLTIDSSGCTLTSLSVHFQTNVSAVAALIKATAGTLCTLSLRLDGATSAELAPKLNTIRLTSLTSLHLAADTGVLIEAIFCKWHTQLRHLKLTNDPIFSSVDEPFYTALCAAVPPMMHPSLTHLELLGSGWEMAEAALAELARRAPNLRLLSMGEVLVPRSAALLKLAAPLLTSIRIPPTSSEGAALSPLHLMHTFTRLTSIHHLVLTSATAPGKEMLALIASSQRHALMLHSVTIVDRAPDALRTVLVHCTALRKLRIGTAAHALAAFPLPSPTTLPHLRKVSLMNLECPVQTVCALMAQLCAVCPNLTRLTVRTFRGQQADTDALRSACRPLMIRVKI